MGALLAACRNLRKLVSHSGTTNLAGLTPFDRRSPPHTPARFERASVRSCGGGTGESPALLCQAATRERGVWFVNEAVVRSATIAR